MRNQLSNKPHHSGLGRPLNYREAVCSITTLSIRDPGNNHLPSSYVRHRAARQPHQHIPLGRVLAPVSRMTYSDCRCRDLRHQHIPVCDHLDRVRKAIWLRNPRLSPQVLPRMPLRQWVPLRALQQQRQQALRWPRIASIKTILPTITIRDSQRPQWPRWHRAPNQHVPKQPRQQQRQHHLHHSKVVLPLLRHCPRGG